MRQKSAPAKEPDLLFGRELPACRPPDILHNLFRRIVLEGLRGEHSIAELCRREGIIQNLYYH